MRLRDRSSGFTLIELMIVLVLLSIVATVALPGFSYVIENNRQTTVSNSLLGMLHYARTEAVRRGETIEVTPSAGSFVVTDLSGTTLREIESLPGDTTIVRTDTGTDDLQFQSSGRSNAMATSATYRVCGASGADGIVIRVNRGGQIITDPNTATCP